jgi:HlyD family secretion protein
MATRLTLLAAGLTACLALSGCGRPAPAAASAQAASRDAVPTVTRGTLERRVLLTGELKAVKAVDIVVPRTPAWQIPIRYMADDGAEVKEGQKVVEFDRQSFAATIDEKRLAALRAASDLRRQQAQNQLDLAGKRQAVAERRVAMEKAQIDAEVPDEVLPRRDWQERALALEKARTEHAKAVDDLTAAQTAASTEEQVRRIAKEQADRQLAVAEQAIAVLSVAAPRAGIFQVGDNPREGRKFEVNDTCWPGLTVARIPDLAVMQVEAALFDVDDGAVAVGMPASCTVDAFPDEVLPGTVELISPLALETARSSLRRVFRVVVSLARIEGTRMRPGMSVKVAVDTGRAADTLLAPRAALDLGASPPLAFPAKGAPVPVTLGPCNGQACVVVAGLSEGQALRRMERR